MRTPAEVRREVANDYYREEFFQSGDTPLSAEQQARNTWGLRLARDALEARRAS